MSSTLGGGGTVRALGSDGRVGWLGGDGHVGRLGGDGLVGGSGSDRECRDEKWHCPAQHRSPPESSGAIPCHSMPE